MKTLKEIANDLDEVAGKMKQCADSMAEHSAELIAAKALLRQWMTKHAGHYRPGGWDYDKEGAKLVQDTADLIGVQDPWKQ